MIQSTFSNSAAVVVDSPAMDSRNGPPSKEVSAGHGRTLSRRGLERLDLMLLCMEALDHNGSEAMVWMSDKLGYNERFPNRVELWKRRCHNPLRRTCRRGDLSMEDSDALIHILCHLAERLYPLAHRHVRRRRVEVGEGSTERRRHRARGARRDRAHLDDEPAAHARAEHAARAEQHLLRLRRVGQHRDRDIGVAHRVGDAGGDADPLPGHALQRLGSHVMDGHVVPGAREVARHVASHDADADEADPCRHAVLPV